MKIFFILLAMTTNHPISSVVDYYKTNEDCLIGLSIMTEIAKDRNLKNVSFGCAEIKNNPDVLKIQDAESIIDRK